MAARLTGKTTPRLWTPPQRRLTRATTRGYEAAEFAEITGEPFLPWQKWLAVHALELNPDGSYRFKTVLVLVARQNGKSAAKRTLSLWKLYLDGARLVLGTAQDLSLAREQWNMCIETIESCPDLAAEMAGKPRRVNGDESFRVAAPLTVPIEEDDDADEWFDLAAGGRYKIAASNRKAGRGLSVDELTIDELREQRNWQAWGALSKTTMARPNAQTWCMSNAGDDESVVLNQLRDRALSGRNPSIGLFEWSAPDGCELDDRRGWAQANPGLGHIITEDSIQSALETDPPNVFRTEVLCKKVDQIDGAVNFAAWQDCADETGTMAALRDRVAACFDMAPDGAHATLAAAARLPDGRVRVEIVATWENAETARLELPALVKKVRPAAFAWYPSGPASALATTLRATALTVNKRPGKTPRSPGEIPEDGAISGGRAAEACMGLAALVSGRQIIQAGQEILNSHIRHAAKLHTGDGWRFTRKGGTGHVDAAYAASGAVNVALTMPEARKPRIRVFNG